MGIERADEELPKLIQAGLMPATLVVSGYLDDVLIGQLLAIKGVVGTLKKPFDFTSLSNAVAQALVRAQDLKLAQSVEAGGAVAADADASVDEPVAEDGWEELS